MEKLPKRKNIRLNEYDYSQVGYYFITICTNDKKNLFWNVGETYSSQFQKPPLSKIGEIVEYGINKINSIYDNVEINKYVIMPNHIHFIIVLHAEEGRSKNTPTISRIVQQLKGSISKQVGFPLWQKSFYDHIIRNQQEYEKIYEYIETNPLKWEEDKYHI
ncbi:transposase [Tepidanaerobacter acetatoxydans]|uniref:transposase n=1 Tax=Tepidanaerobacter acetatoxydans TaxID=499229 RepID=UPI001BD5139A|nr:transposase [Tepidanaerobacter acetatoxydans]